MGLFNNIVIKNIRFRSKCCTKNDKDTPSIPSTPCCVRTLGHQCQ